MREEGKERNETKMKSRLQHPLLLALIQRAIQDGFYGTDTKSWDCNAYGDRIQQSSSLLLVELTSRDVAQLRSPKVQVGSRKLRISTPRVQISTLRDVHGAFL